MRADRWSEREMHLFERVARWNARCWSGDWSTRAQSRRPGGTAYRTGMGAAAAARPVRGCTLLLKHSHHFPPDPRWACVAVDGPRPTRNVLQPPSAGAGQLPRRHACRPLPKPRLAAQAGGPSRGRPRAASRGADCAPPRRARWGRQLPGTQHGRGSAGPKWNKPLLASRRKCAASSHTVLASRPSTTEQ
jgi:hypothetical protein